MAAASPNKISEGERLMLKRLLLPALLMLTALAHPAAADGSKVVTTCGSESLTVNNINPFDSETTTGRKCVDTGNETYLGHQDLTVTTAAAITPTSTATIADLVADPANAVPVFCLADGGTPSASIGIPLSQGGSWHIATDAASLASVKCFASVSSVIHIEYGK
jgi:hypothetical protein